MKMESFAEFKATRFQICNGCNAEKHVSLFNENGLCTLCIKGIMIEAGKGGKGNTKAMRNPCRPYHDKIVEMCKAGFFAQEIVSAIGDPAITRRKLYGYCHYRKIGTGNGRSFRSSWRHVSDDMLETVRLMLAGGHTNSEIAAATGESRNRIAGWAHRYGLRDLEERPETFARVK
jgi:hypothetical protein